MVKVMEMVLKLGRTEENILENLKMMNLTDKVLLHILMDQNMLENGEMESGMVKER